MLLKQRRRVWEKECILRYSHSIQYCDESVTKLEFLKYNLFTLASLY